MTKPRLRIGLIGTGFMGKAHVFGFTAAPRVFDLPYELDLHTLADITPEAAAEAARRFGFAHATANWQGIMANPEIDLVSITAPNALHKEMSLAAIAAGAGRWPIWARTPWPRPSFSAAPSPASWATA